MSLVCPHCRLLKQADPGVRLELCPRCAADGRDVYLARADDADPPRRRDLIGLLATARAELSRAKEKLDGEPNS